MTLKNFNTCVRRVTMEGRCYGCGKEGTHRWYDPEANAMICLGCLVSYIRAEYILLQTPGICRPAVPNVNKTQ